MGFHAQHATLVGQAFVRLVLIRYLTKQVPEWSADDIKGAVCYFEHVATAQIPNKAIFYKGLLAMLDTDGYDATTLYVESTVDAGAISLDELKDPCSRLQHYCQRRSGTLPDYEAFQRGSAAFSYAATYKGHRTLGSGRSIQVAKADAATRLLNMFIE
jgi:dsRNA-specific ribonuclease